MSNVPCESGLIIKGEYFPCDMMESMVEGSENHYGWSHSSKAAEAIWRND